MSICQQSFQAIHFSARYRVKSSSNISLIGSGLSTSLTTQLPLSATSGLAAIPIVGGALLGGSVIGSKLLTRAIAADLGRSHVPIAIPKQAEKSAKPSQSITPIELHPPKTEAEKQRESVIQQIHEALEKLNQEDRLQQQHRDQVLSTYAAEQKVLAVMESQLTASGINLQQTIARMQTTQTPEEKHKISIDVGKQAFAQESLEQEIKTKRDQVTTLKNHADDANTVYQEFQSVRLRRQQEYQDILNRLAEMDQLALIDKIRQSKEKLDTGTGDVSKIRELKDTLDRQYFQILAATEEAVCDARANQSIRDQMNFQPISNTSEKAP